ncbi:MAG: T9SS type A sorting domain-containing protein [Bacteroidia bacterium]|nr:T9SS type A sorting domain-containing protein [Bacteroidia bacterium]
MKKIFKYISVLAFLLICTNYILTAQIYYPIVDYNKRWLSLETCIWGPNPILNPYYIDFFDDTIINSETYLKVYKCVDTSLLEWNHIGFIRENTEKKIFYKSKLSNEEGLLYDFNVEIGDTINVINTFLNNLFHPLIVLNIDSILINNVYRKRISFTNSFNNESWTEGIGSTLGILNSSFADTSGCSYELICHLENDSLLYLNPNYSSCNILDITNSIKKKLNNKNIFKIYPNPITENSVIISGLNNKALMKVYNINGKIIKTYKIQGNQTINIGRDKFSSGFYFYKVIMDNQLITCGKFIIL